MLSIETRRAAEDFARALRQSPTIVALQAAEAALDADPQAQALMDELRRLQQAFIAAQRAGQPAPPDVAEALRTCQSDVRRNELIMAQLRATNEAKAFLPLVAAEVTRALGTDYATLIKPSGCC